MRIRSSGSLPGTDNLDQGVLKRNPRFTAVIKRAFLGYSFTSSRLLSSAIPDKNGVRARKMRRRPDFGYHDTDCFGKMKELSL
jgi:hypothetical protein